MNTRSFRRSFAGFTLVELMLVIAIIAMLAAIAMPSIYRARKRSQATRMLYDLRLVEGAVQEFGFENNLAATTPVTSADTVELRKFIKKDASLHATLPNDMMGNPITYGYVGGYPSFSMLTFDAYSDVAPLDFWRPFTPSP